MMPHEQKEAKLFMKELRDFIKIANSKVAKNPKEKLYKKIAALAIRLYKKRQKKLDKTKQLTL
jgi:hypothetical protein